MEGFAADPREAHGRSIFRNSSKIKRTHESQYDLQHVWARTSAHQHHNIGPAVRKNLDQVAHALGACHLPKGSVDPQNMTSILCSQRT